MSDEPDLFTRLARSREGDGGASEPRPDRGVAWHPSLTHRLRVLLHTFPLYDLSRGDARRDPELRHYDSLALAIKVLDLIIDHAGLDDEVDRRAVDRALSPLLRAMDAAAGKSPDERRHSAIVDRVLGGLRNDDAGRRPFEVTYQVLGDDGQTVSRRLEFRLVVDHFHPAGGTVLRLSNEAVNLYLNALDLDVEDAQAAAEAVVQSQLARGRLEEAVQSARNARWQSLRYEEKVVGVMRETRRDVGRLDWHEDIPKLLAEALEHIQSRLRTEEAILEAAEERLDLLPENDDQGRAVGEVARLIRDCRQRHVDLHDQLMRARNVFLDEQARQAFHPSPLLPRPELLAEVLEPVMRMGRGDAGRAAERAFPGFFGARAPAMVSLADLAAWQLRPRRERPAPELAVLDADLTTHTTDLSHYPPALRARAAELFTGLEGPTTLAALLETARAQGASVSLLELVVLMALHQFAPEENALVPVAVNRAPGRKLRTAGFYGDELDIRPLAAEVGDDD